MFDGKELMQIIMSDDENNFEVVYPIRIEESQLTFANLGPSGEFRGISVRSLEKINAIRTQSLYLKEFIKKVDVDNIWQQIDKTIVGIEKFTIDGWLEFFKGKDEIVAITHQDLSADLAGRIINIKNDLLELDEYYSEYDERFAKTLIRKDGIIMATIDAPWLQTITRAVKDRGL